MGGERGKDEVSHEGRSQHGSMESGDVRERGSAVISTVDIRRMKTRWMCCGDLPSRRIVPAQTPRRLSNWNPPHFRAANQLVRLRDHSWRCHEGKAVIWCATETSPRRMPRTALYFGPRGISRDGGARGKKHAAGLTAVACCTYAPWENRHWEGTDQGVSGDNGGTRI